MDGDSPDLPGLRRVCDSADAGMIVDEAHALGVFGPGGAGLCAASDTRPEALVGTLGKAVGVQGAFVAGSDLLRRWLWNRARTVVFTTAPSPVLTAIALAHVRRARSDDEGRRRLARHADQLRVHLRSGGVPLLEHGHGPIVPLVAGSNERVLALAAAVAKSGFRVRAIRPPSVPPDGARLRVTLRANLSDGDVERLAGALVTAWRSLG
jgi:8-amino-7-oxononanoate synthase